MNRSPCHSNIKQWLIHMACSEMLSSEISVFENFDCGEPCQLEKRRNRNGKTMHQSGDHASKWRPCLKVASILATIRAPCALLKGHSAPFTASRQVRSTLGNHPLSTSPLSTLKGGGLGRTMQNDVHMIIDIFGRRRNRSLYFFSS